MAEAVGIAGVMDVPGKLFRGIIKTVQPAAGCPNPKRARMIRINRPDMIVAEAAGIVRIVDKARQFSGRAIQTIKPVTRSNPKLRPARIFIETADAIRAETVRIVGIMNVMSKLRRCGIKFFKSRARSFKSIKSAIGSNPERVVGGFVDGPNGIVAQAFGIFGIVHKMGELLLCRIIAI
ncbi:MAG: hypothetical protein ALAOOOJD_00513 [bacterium]|nr:hypothetical protein [bacterium]